MVKNVMRQFKAPLSKHDWAQKWCVDVHNVTANRNNNWETPMAISTSETPDISKFRSFLGANLVLCPIQDT